MIGRRMAPIRTCKGIASALSRTHMELLQGPGAGTWITYQGQESTEAVVDYGKALGVAGFFTWDTSMDSLSPKYKLHRAIVERMGGGTPTPPPSPPSPSPTPSP